MKLAARAENLLERLLLAAGFIPTPFLETHAAMLLSRTIASATRAGVFEALADRPRSAQQVSESCALAPGATSALLEALWGTGYLVRRGELYRLAPRARRWLLKNARRSLHDHMRWQLTEWEWLGELDRYLSDGIAIDMHARMNSAQWDAYGRGMLATAKFLAPEVARRTPIPAHARDMLDLGGSHGYFSVALCRRHPRLRSVVLDLPAALSATSDELAGKRMDGRVSQRPGNVLEEDLGMESWDVVFMSQLAHHFDESTNRDLSSRIARALRPGGVFVIQDLLRAEDSARGQLTTLYHLYFALTSAAGAWSLTEMASWQESAGLRTRPAVRFVSAPGLGQQAAFKDSSRRA